jgi:hypothetical protein
LIRIVVIIRRRGRARSHISQPNEIGDEDIEQDHGIIESRYRGVGVQWRMFIT